MASTDELLNLIEHKRIDFDSASPLATVDEVGTARNTFLERMSRD